MTAALELLYLAAGLATGLLAWSRAPPVAVNFRDSLTAAIALCIVTATWPVWLVRWRQNSGRSR